MKKIIFAMVAFALVAGTDLAPVRAQSTDMNPAPVAVSAMTPEPGKTPVSAMTPEPGKTPTVKPAKAQVTTPAWKTAEFWILKVVLPILLFVLGLGFFKREWVKWAREKGIVAIADKVISGFEAYAKKTKVKWDDAAAQALKAVFIRFGELSPAEEAKVKALVEERKEQAEKR